MELIVFKAKATTPEELEMVRQALNGLFGDDSMSPEEIQKLKKSERNKKDYQNRKLKNAENAESAESDREEREEKEAGSSPLSPSSPSSSPSDSPNNIPITPLYPPLPEEKGEREEMFGETNGKRGELRSFGPHVKLSEKEFLSLQEKFGYEEVMKMIRNMNNYIGEDDKLVKKYQTRNHYLTLLNWKRRDEEKQQHPQQKKTYSFAEVGQMMRNGEL